MGPLTRMKWWKIGICIFIHLFYYLLLTTSKHPFLNFSLPQRNQKTTNRLISTFRSLTISRIHLFLYSLQEYSKLKYSSLVDKLVTLFPFYADFFEEREFF